MTLRKGGTSVFLFDILKVFKIRAQQANRDFQILKKPFKKRDSETAL